MPIFADADVFGEASDMQRASVGVNDLILELESTALYLSNPAADGQLLTIHGWLDIARADFSDRQIESAALKAGVVVSALARVVCPSLLKIEDIAGMVDNSHGVCFGITNVEAGFADETVYRCQSQNLLLFGLVALLKHGAHLIEADILMRH